MQRICIFVDGENFRHSIVDLFENFRGSDYLPDKANWETFFNFLSQRADGDARLIRTYWYVIELLDVFPYKYPKERDVLSATQDSVRWFLKYDRQFKNEMSQINQEDFATKLQEKTSLLKRDQQRLKDRFAGWRRVQDGIVGRWPRIEFRRAGAISYNAFTRKLGSEKAVDVKLATDLVLLRDSYDIAIIVSGDQDYVPAVQAVKDSGKIVYNVVFKTRSGKLLPGGARRLNHLTDCCIEITHNELIDHLNIPPRS